MMKMTITIMTSGRVGETPVVKVNKIISNSEVFHVWHCYVMSFSYNLKGLVTVDDVLETELRGDRGMFVWKLLVRNIIIPL